MDRSLQELVAAIHACPFQATLVLTGGAAHLAAWLFSVPGASRTILEVHVPYGSRSFAEYLGHVPEHYCSRTTAAAMARRARQRTAWLADGSCEQLLGIAATASLVTSRPKKGAHRCHAAVWDGVTLHGVDVYLAKGKRDRLEEDTLVSKVVLNLLAEALRLEALPVELTEGDRLEQWAAAEPSPLWRLLHGDVRRVTQLPGGAMTVGAERPKAVLPGSFNPLHGGHRRLAELAERRLNTRVHFELSVTNVDKPRLTEPEIRRRARQFEWYRPLELTDAPLFVQKARLFPGAVFVVGADTAARIVADRYYPDGQRGMWEALDEIHRQGCRFLVAARRDPQGQILELSRLPVPHEFRELFEAIPLNEFLYDISATALRQAGRPVVP